MRSKKNKTNTGRTTIFQRIFKGRTSIDMDLIARFSNSDTTSYNIEQNRDITEDNLDDIDEYCERIKIIAHGSHSVVYEARDKRFDRIIAVKSLADSLKKDSAARQSFLLEARILGRLEHPAILPVSNLCKDGTGGLHLAMKLVAGRELSAYIKKLSSLYELISTASVKKSERLSLTRRLELFIRICDAMSYAHNRNVLHNSLSPENIMLGKYNEVYILDWNNAEYISKSSDPNFKFELDKYSAPELFVDCTQRTVASDIYSLGAMLYELVFVKVFSSHENISLEHTYGVHVRTDLCKIVAKTLSTDPAERYVSVRELAEDLRRFIVGMDVLANKLSLIAFIFRKMRRLRQKICIGMNVLLMFAVLCLGIGLWEVQRNSSEKLTAHESAAFAFSGTLETAIECDRFFRAYDEQLKRAAYDAGIMIHNSILEKSSKDNELSEELVSYDCEKSKGMVSNTKYSDKPRYEFAFSTVSYKLPDVHNKKDYEAALDYLKNVPEIKRVFEKVIFMTGLFKKKIFADFMPLCVFAGFENGLHISYPYKNDYSGDYDPRKRMWYKAAKDLPAGSSVWSQPYNNATLGRELVITCSTPIIGSEQKVCGVMGVDIVLSDFVRILTETKDSSSYFIEKMLVRRNGEVVASSNLNDGEKSSSVRFFHDSDMLSKMLFSGSGYIETEENGEKVIYSYMLVESVSWIYIEKIDYKKLFDFYRRKNDAK